MEINPEMRLKSFETKLHTRCLFFSGRRNNVASWPPAPLPELASSASVAVGLIPDHDSRRQHLWNTHGSKWRVGLRRDHGAGWCGHGFDLLCGSSMAPDRKTRRASLAEPVAPACAPPVLLTTLFAYIYVTSLLKRVSFIFDYLPAAAPCLSTWRDMREAHQDPPKSSALFV